VSGCFTGPRAADGADGLFVAVDPIRLLDTHTANADPVGNAAQQQPDWTLEIATSPYAAMVGNGSI
jgi:hypothetical protein